MAIFSPRLLELARLVDAGHRQAAYPLLEAAVLEQVLPCLPPDATAAASATGLPPSIPSRIVQYWHSPRRPDDVDRSIERLRVHNPAFAFEVVDDEVARAFISSHLGAGLAEIFDCCFHNAMKSDFYRMCDLFVQGGVYIDVDIHCFGPLAPVFEGGSFGCFMMHAVGAPYCIENGLLAVVPGNPLIEAILRGMEANLRDLRDRGVFENVWACTGPGVTTETIMAWFAAELTGRSDRFTRAGFMSARNTRSAISYGHDELAYKQTNEGNWRRAAAPKRS